MSFKDQILKNLEGNGFPGKRVSLPLEVLYEKADEKGENLNKILEEMAAEGISHEKTGDRIIFSQGPETNASREEMMRQAQEMMGQMTPEQIRQAQEALANMSEEEKQELMEKARQMGLL